MKNFTRFSLAIFFVFETLSARSQNYAVSFDGVNDYVNVSAPIASNSSYTKEAWIYAITTGGNRNILSSNSTPFWISGGFLQAGQAGVYSRVVDPSAFPTNTWMHVAVTYDHATQTMKLYKNGKLVSTATSVPAYTSETWYIGSHVAGSSVFQGQIEEMRIWNVARTISEIKNGMYGSVSVSSPGLVAYYKMNDGSGTTLTNSAGGSNGTLVNGPAWVSSPVQFSPNAIALDGVDDYGLALANSSYDISSGTIECWVRPGTLTGNACIVANRGNGGTRWSFHMSTTEIGLWNNVSFNTVAFASTPGTWYHLAFVCNGSNTAIYVNGSSIGSTGSVFSGITGQTLTIGATYMSSVIGEPFAGSIDEIRIWNTIRTPTEIQTYKDVTLSGNETGLVGLFSFDQGIAGGTNSGITVATEKTAASNHAILSNMAMTGASSNWSSHSLITLPVKLTVFSAAAQGEKVRLQWQTETEQNSKEFIIERSAGGNNYHAIGSVTASGNSSATRYYSFDDIAPRSGSNYYRLKLVDIDGRFEYSPVRKADFTIDRRLSWYTTGTGAVEIKLLGGNNEQYAVSDMSGRNMRRGSLLNGKLQLALTAGTYNVVVDTEAGRRNCLIVVR